MKKQAFVCLLSAAFAFLLSGCETAEGKTTNLSAVYSVTALLSLAVLVCYCFIKKKKDAWHLLLFSSVLVVNLGYVWLSVSKELSWALTANRFSYLGSVFLPLSMFMIALNTAQINYKRWVTWTLLGVGGVVFLVAASPGYLDIYYKDVTLETVNGFFTLNKVYGPLHSLYLVYLVGYFAAMIYTIIYAFRKNSTENKVYTIILSMAVFVNIGVWFIEQLVHIDFEVLSVSYVISELFLFGLNMLMAEHSRLKTQAQSDNASPASDKATGISEEKIQLYKTGLRELTKTERLIYDAYVEGKSTKEIMELLNIKENTLKFHNKNIYGKLGVSSRKQLVEFSKEV